MWRDRTKSEKADKGNQETTSPRLHTVSAFHQRAWMSREATGNIRWMPAVSTNT